MDFERFSWEVRPDGKVHFFAKDRGGFHWTLHPGTNSNALDLHETWIDSEGMTAHKTLFMMKVEDLIKLANEIGPALLSSFL